MHPPDRTQPTAPPLCLGPQANPCLSPTKSNPIRTQTSLDFIPNELLFKLEVHPDFRYESTPTTTYKSHRTPPVLPTSKTRRLYPRRRTPSQPSRHCSSPSQTTAPRTASTMPSSSPGPVVASRSHQAHPRTIECYRTELRVVCAHPSTLRAPPVPSPTTRTTKVGCSCPPLAPEQAAVRFWPREHLPGVPTAFCHG